MTEHQRRGVTRQIIQLFEDNRGRALSIERIAQSIDYEIKNTSSLISQLRKNRPNLVIECPTAGVFIYQGTRTVDAVLAAEARSKPVTRAAGVASIPRRAAARSGASVSANVGDLVEVIGLSQDSTPIARDQAGKLYLLQPL